ncbi:MAG: TIM barrel protein [Gemmataceae bacterium]
MSAISRRAFVQAALVSGAGLVTPSAWAIDPIRRKGKPRFTLSLAAYSFHRYLNLKRSTPPEMTLEEFIDLGGRLGLPAVELTAYYFPRTSDEYLKEIASRCSRLGLSVSGTAVGNNFCLKDSDKLRAEINMVRRWTEHSALLGAKTMRIFAGTVGKGDSETEARKRCIDAIQEACEYAARHKVILALENHGGITSTPEQMLAIVEAIKSDWFGVNLDTGNFHTADPYADLARIAPYAVVAQVKTEIAPRGKKKEDADLGRLVEILRKVNFQGYVALEYEALEDPRTAVPRHLKELKKHLG